MANKRFFMGMLVMVLVFGMVVVGCDDGSTSSVGSINGTYVSDDEQIKLTDGNFEMSISGTTAFKGTYSTSGNSVTFTLTQVWGGLNVALSNKWYSRADLKAAGFTDSDLNQLFTPFSGTVNGNRLTLTWMGETTTYIK